MEIALGSSTSPHANTDFGRGEAASGIHLVLQKVTRPQFSSVNCTAQPEVRRVVAAVPPPSGLLRVELVEAALLAKHR